MEKQISVLFILVVFIFTTFGCNKTVIKDDTQTIADKKDGQKINCSKDTVYLVDKTSIENTTIYSCINELGRIEGKLVAFYTDTQKIKALAEFRKNLKVGKWVKWSKTGEIISIENFNDRGQPHGYAIAWINIGADKHCVILELSKGVPVNLAYEYKNERILKILKVKSPGRNGVEIQAPNMTEYEIDFLNELYKEIISKETEDLPIP
ncbi:MAG: hypothetical protein L3J07_00280 [Candidatus Magasanikbacteria bacterium]|nr:hypothetical protein [Candidatus Magasanikbacteria bacterium]